MNDKKLNYKNASGCCDPTAYKAIRNVDGNENENENKNNDERFHKLLHSIFDICELSDFKLEGRIVLVDKRSGKVYK